MVSTPAACKHNFTSKTSGLHQLCRYYRAGKQEELKSDIRCQQCHNPLTLFCVNCHLISPSTPTSKTAPSETAADKDCLSVTGRQSPPSKSALPPQADQDIKTEGGHQPTPSEGRSLRRKRLTRSCEKSKKLVEVVFSSEDEQPGSDEEDSFADDGWPQIEETLRVEDSNDNKEDPSYSLDDFLTSFEEQTRKKPRIKNHECPQCGETFLDILCLKNHFEETKHISEYICKQCDKPFKNKSALQQHGRVHNRQEHQCSICGLSFKFPSRLNKHIKTHGTDKPHICEKCGKSFVSVYYLRDHIKIHSEERRYKCDQCGAAFKQKPALYAHGKKHTNERPFQCQYCGLKFRDSQKVREGTGALRGWVGGNWVLECPFLNWNVGRLHGGVCAYKYVLSQREKLPLQCTHSTLNTSWTKTNDIKMIKKMDIQNFNPSTPTHPPEHVQHTYTHARVHAREWPFQRKLIWRNRYSTVSNKLLWLSADCQ